MLNVSFTLLGKYMQAGHLHEGPALKTMIPNRIFRRIVLRDDNDTNAHGSMHVRTVISPAYHITHVLVAVLEDSQLSVCRSILLGT